MYTKQIESLNADTLFQILELVSRIKDTSCTLKQYAQYLTDYLPSDCIGLFGIFDEEKIIGFVQTHLPHPLDPKVGYIRVAADMPNAPKDAGKEVLLLAEQWLKSHGADRWRAYSERKPRLWKRRFNVNCIGKIGNDYVIEKLI